MILPLILLLVLAQLFLLVRANKEQHFFQVLPSTVWTSIMLIPFSVLVKYFPIDVSITQGIAISVVAIVLQVSDYVALRLKRRAGVNVWSPANLKFDTLFKVSITLSILIPILHFIIARQIPFLEQISGEHSPEEIAAFREQFSKLLDIPFYFKILPNYILALFGPYSLIVLIAQKRYFSALCLFLWCTMYSLSSTADLPFLIYIGTAILGCIPLLPIKKVRIVAILVMSGLSLSIFSGLVLTNIIDSSSRPCVTNSPNISTPGDKWRSCAGNQIVWVNVITDRIGYRVFITPIEVSNLWYQHYQSESMISRSVLSILNRDLNKMPANVIGNKFFVEKFPGKYKKSNTSFSSLDADAFSFGIPFFLLMLVVLIFMRLSAAWHFVRLNNNAPALPDISDKTPVLSYFMVAQLSIFPFQSSVQAIMFSQGFLIVFFVYVFQVIQLRKLQENPCH